MNGYKKRHSHTTVNIHLPSADVSPVSASDVAKHVQTYGQT